MNFVNVFLDGLCGKLVFDENSVSFNSAISKN